MQPAAAPTLIARLAAELSREWPALHDGDADDICRGRALQDALSELRPASMRDAATLAAVLADDAAVAAAAAPRDPAALRIALLAEHLLDFLCHEARTSPEALGLPAGRHVDAAAPPAGEGREYAGSAIEALAAEMAATSRRMADDDARTPGGFSRDGDRLIDRNARLEAAIVHLKPETPRDAAIVAALLEARVTGLSNEEDASPMHAESAALARNVTAWLRRQTGADLDIVAGFDIARRPPAPAATEARPA